MGLTAFNRLRREAEEKRRREEASKPKAEAVTATVAAEESRTEPNGSVPAEDKAPVEKSAEGTKTSEPEAEEHKSKPGRKKTVKEESDSEKADLF